mgnify:CR=1 FL=1
MANFNIDAKKEMTYDAIVIGSGISGGWAAKELCEKGLKTLVLERGRNVEHVKDYVTAYKAPWQLENRGKTPQSELDEHYPKQSRTGYTTKEASKHWFVKDSEHPYQEVKRFDKLRQSRGRTAQQAVCGFSWGGHNGRNAKLSKCSQ